jgi:hypothetical protein
MYVELGAIVLRSRAGIPNCIGLRLKYPRGARRTGVADAPTATWVGHDMPRFSAHIAFYPFALI